MKTLTLWAMFVFAWFLAAGVRGEEAWRELLPGANLAAWRQPRGDWATAATVALDAKDPTRLAWTPGAGPAVNGPKGRTVNLVSAAEFGDVEVHVEFMISRHSNSGVYFMGRYELQVYDSYGVAKDLYPGIECGGIYPRWINGANVNGHSPRVNASLPPGQWQTFDVQFRAPLRRGGQEDGQRPVREGRLQRPGGAGERGGHRPDPLGDGRRREASRAADAARRSRPGGLSQRAGAPLGGRGPELTFERRSRMSLKGKIAVVTGASRGIGRAIAVRLAKEGRRWH